MADEAIGQAAADSTGTTANAPGDSGGSIQTTVTGPDASDSFFDPKSIEGKPELMAAYKQMQSAFTKKSTEVSKYRQKIDAYDRFEKDPMGTMRQLAQAYGWQLVQGGQQDPNQPWNPQSWDDVMAKAEEKVLEKMKPVFDEVKTLKKQNVEAYLDSHYTDWRTYEDQMMETLKEHPSLVKDPDSLYRLSVPAEVLEARAIKAAQQKLKGTQDNAAVSGGTTSKQTTEKPSGPLSFAQAAELARKRMAAGAR